VIVVAALDVRTSILALCRRLSALPLGPLSGCGPVPPAYENDVRELAELARKASCAADPSLDRCEELAALAPLLHRFRAAYEYARERWWAHQVLAHERPVAALAALEEETRAWALDRLMVAELAQCRHIAFVGCGPLPVTALALTRSTKAEITAIDCDPEAVEIARRIVAVAGAERRIRVEPGDATRIELPRGADAVVASVLTGVDRHGTEHDRTRAVSHLIDILPHGVKLVVREPRGLGWLLYPRSGLPSLPGLSAVRKEPGPDERPYFTCILTFEKRAPCAPPATSPISSDPACP